MEHIIQFQINLFSLIVLIILFVIIRTRITIASFGIKIIQYTIFFTALGIISEPLSWIFSNELFFGAYFLEYSTNFLLILLAPVIASLLLVYVDYYLFHDLKMLRKRLYYLHPAIFTLIMLFVNFFYPVYFYINPVQNSYHQGDWIAIQYILTGFMYIFMIVRLLIFRERITKRVMFIFMLFFGIPILGIIVQLFYSKFFFSWTSLSLSIMVLYISLETLNSEKDYLSGLYNRQSYDKFINQIIEQKKIVQILLFDLDDFKAINDSFGHHEGDIVISAFGNILQKVFPKSKMVTRVGGDEFIVVVEEQNQIEADIQTIYTHLKHSQLKHLQNISFSYGHYTNTLQDSFDDIYVTVDKRMYEFKKESTNLKRRAVD